MSDYVNSNEFQPVFVVTKAFASLSDKLPGPWAEGDFALYRRAERGGYSLVILKHVVGIGTHDFPRADRGTAGRGSMLVWGGEGSNGAEGSGALYSPELDQWLPMAEPGPGARLNANAAWRGDRLVVWGGEALTQGSSTNTFRRKQGLGTLAVIGRGLNCEGRRKVVLWERLSGPDKAFLNGAG